MTLPPAIAALVLAGLTCSPQCAALLCEIEEREPEFFALLPAALAHPDMLRVARRPSTHTTTLPPCDVSRALLVLCGCAHLQVSGARIDDRWPPPVGPAAARVPWWVVERVLGSHLTSWWEWHLGSGNVMLRR